MQEESGVKDRWRGGSPWLHKRGFGSAEAREGPGRPPEGILDGAGDSPPVLVWQSSLGYPGVCVDGCQCPAACWLIDNVGRNEALELVGLLPR